MIKSFFTLISKIIMITCVATCVSSISYANNVVLKSQGGVYPVYPATNPNCGLDQAQVKRGEYLAKIGDCLACHTNTKEKGDAFAGGLPFDTPFGIFYSPNISPDKETGIGKWTKDDFVRAVREGLSPDGSNYYPVFPFVYFNHVNDADAADLYAYLRCVPAVSQKNRDNKASFPFNQRFLLSGWKLLFFDFHKGVYENDSTQSEAWNRGAYIVEGLGHCGMCHTPMNPFGAAITQKNLGGSVVDNFPVPNITSAVLKNYSVSQIVDVFEKDEMIGDKPGTLAGPMLEVNHDSLQYLTKEDLTAIATYLKTVKAVPLPVISTSGSASEVGKSVYENNCTACHATGAAGAPVFGNVKDWAPRIQQGLAALQTHAIEGIKQMPAKGGCSACTTDQINAAVAYMVDSSNGSDKSAETVKIVKTAPPPFDNSIELGLKIYNQSCAMCHADSKYGAPVLGDKAAWAKLIDKGIDILFTNTIKGIGKMPAKGACPTCTNEQLEAAVKYMVQQAAPEGSDYSLW